MPKGMLLVAAGALVAGPAAAQIAAVSPWSLQEAVGAPEALKLSGSVRLRYEAIDGQARPGFNDADRLVNVRTVLFAEYDTGPVRFGGELWDSRVDGADRGTPVTTGEVNTLEFVQAYAALDLSEPFGDGTTAMVQAGRFTLNLGSRRLVAADDFRNTTNGYTGLRTDLGLRGGVKATLVYVQPQVRRPDDLQSLLDGDRKTDLESDDLELWGGIVSRAKTFGETALEASYFRLDERDAAGRPTRDRSLDTLSVRLLREPAAGRADHELEVIVQGGETSAGLGPASPRADVQAWFVHADAGYTLKHRWKPRLSAEFDYASGDDAGGDSNRFDTLFGMRRADLAPSGLYNAVGRANIATPAVRLEATPSPLWDVFAAYRLMWLASDTDSFSTTGVRDPSGGSGGFAGRQLEGRLRRWIVRDALRLEANGVWLDKGRFLRTAPNAPRNGDTLYGSISLMASF